MSKPALRVRIYGARGSYSSTSNHGTSFGVNTTCFRVDLGEQILIVDAGSGIINCGGELIKELQREHADRAEWPVYLLFTHMHIDHLAGLPFFAPLYSPKSNVHFIGPQILDYKLEDAVRTFVHPPFFPVGIEDLPFRANFHEIAENKAIYLYKDRFELRPLIEKIEPGWLSRITSMRNYTHPKGGSFFYRFETAAGAILVIATDTEGFVGGDQRLIKFAKGADILLHDAQYDPGEYGMMQGFGHSTYEMACEVAEKAEVKKLVLVHHDPRYDDEKLRSIEKKARERFAQTLLAVEGMELAL